MYFVHDFKVYSGLNLHNPTMIVTPVELRRKPIGRSRLHDLFFLHYNYTLDLYYFSIILLEFGSIRLIFI